ncbi:MAG: hypothetical protein V3V14_06690 [Saprospiraceae bacterium]
MKFLLIFASFLISFDSLSQDFIGNLTTITTNQKIKYSGEIDHITNDSVYLKLKQTTTVISVAKSNIKKINIKSNVLNKYDNFATKPYYVPTAYNAGEGNHYYRNYFLFAHDFNFGITDHLDISVGIETLSPFVKGAPSLPIMQLGGKYGFGQGTFRVGLSAQGVFNSEGGVFIASMPFTIGSRKNNFTIGPSYVNSEGYPLLLLSGNLNHQLSNKLFLSTDYLYIVEEDILTATTFLNIATSKKVSFIVGIIYAFEGLELQGVTLNLGLTVPFRF